MNKHFVQKKNALISKRHHADSLLSVACVSGSAGQVLEQSKRKVIRLSSLSPRIFATCDAPVEQVYVGRLVLELKARLRRNLSDEIGVIQNYLKILLEHHRSEQSTRLALLFQNRAKRFILFKISKILELSI